MSENEHPRGEHLKHESEQMQRPQGTVPGDRICRVGAEGKSGYKFERHQHTGIFNAMGSSELTKEVTDREESQQQP